ncbi:MAG: hypothetical protein J0M08_02635 [Bacteroidetes bacterium]|nr:hypothetical protein [Bacteroidota bacterium]
MQPKYLIFASPLIIFAEFYLFSWIAELLSKQSDSAVLAGVALFCVFAIGNYFLIRYIVLLIKNRKKDEKKNPNA